MEKDIGLIGMFLICRVFILYYYVKFVNIVELVWGNEMKNIF